MDKMNKQNHLTQENLQHISDEMENKTNSENVEGEPIDEVELSNFKENVRQWIRLDDETRKFAEEVKKIQKKKKELQKKRDEMNSSILYFMNKYNIGDLNTSNGRIKYAISSTKSPINLKTLKEKLVGYYNDENEAEKLLKFLEDNREKNEKISLKRTITKQTMTL